MGLLFSILIARSIGAQGSGIYFLSLSIVQVCVVIGSLGLNHTLLRHVSANASVGNWRAVNGVYSTGMKMAAFSSVAVALMIVFLSPVMSTGIFSKSALARPLSLMSFAIVPLVFVALHGEVLRGLKRIRDSHLVDGSVLPFTALLVFLLIGRDYGINGAVWSYLAASLTAAVSGLLLWRISTAEHRTVKGSFDRATLLASSRPLFLVALMNVLISNASILMLGIWNSESDIGIFSIANRTTILFIFILMSVNSIAAPKFSALHKANDLYSIETMARHSVLIMMVLATPIFFLFVLAPEWILHFFGDDFVSGAPVLVILTVGLFVNVATGSVGFILIMTGNERLARNNAFMATVICILLNLILIPSFGIIGAAIATAFSVAFKNLAASYLVWSKLNICAIPFAKRLQVKQSRSD
ncbi:MAG: oligosaccharide flippase family protein [Thermodesulfovibrionales bacterium]|nr:oligosaccharide flippase family protein [Thermodesulfovibrionales bacterium]